MGIVIGALTLITTRRQSSGRLNGRSGPVEANSAPMHRGTCSLVTTRRSGIITWYVTLSPLRVLRTSR